MDEPDVDPFLPLRDRYSPAADFGLTPGSAPPSQSEKHAGLGSPGGAPLRRDADDPANPQDPKNFQKTPLASALKSDRSRPISPLQAALRRARIENAEQADVLETLHNSEIARLDILNDRLAPILDEIPDDCDFFDVTVSRSANPRLFIDMIAFVEMSRDRKTYRLRQDSRNGRLLLAESENIDVMVRAIADYIARRLIERDKALASDSLLRYPSASVAQKSLYKHSDNDGDRKGATAGPAQTKVTPARARPHFLRVISRIFVLLIEILGAVALFAAVSAACWWLWMESQA